MEKYLNLFTNYGFKKVFGEAPNKDLLISFLNSLLPAKHQIVDLGCSLGEWLGAAVAKREEVLGWCCKAPDGTAFIVELQMATYNWFKDRHGYLASFPIQQQAALGTAWDCRFAAVYSIGVLGFRFATDDKSAVVHTVPLQNPQCAGAGDKLTAIYISVPHFKKTLVELDSTLDRWLYLFHHLPTLQAMPPHWPENVFGKLFQIGEVVTLPAEERLAHENSLKIYRDLKNVIDTAFEEGRKIGLAKAQKIAHEKMIAQAIEAGARQKAGEAACMAIAMGLPDAQIAVLSGLSTAQIAALRRQLPS